MQCIFLVWCFAPTEWNGSTTLYYRFIRPFILRHQEKIDKAVDEAKDALNEGQYPPKAVGVKGQWCGLFAVVDKRE